MPTQQRRFSPVVPAFTAPGGDQIPVDRAYGPVQTAQYRNWARRSQGLGQTTIANAFTSAMARQLKSVTIQTQISPDLNWSPSAGAQAQGGGVGEWFLKNVVKPRVLIEGPAGQMVVNPYGDPNTNLFPLIALALTAGAISVGVLALKGLRKG